MEYQLSPSDLTYLYEGCKRCFALKVKHGIPQPTIPLPSIFSSIAYLQKEHYSNKRTEQISPQVPKGIIRYGEKRVKSIPVSFSGLSSTCTIRGRFDIVAELDDSTYAVLDFKTANPSDEKASLYSRQLHAYAYALEHPAEGELELKPITALGLLYFVPDHCEQTGPERQIIGGSMQWQVVNVDKEGFQSFLREVISLLDGPLPEADVESCEWCKYHAKTRSHVSALPAGTDNSVGLQETPNCPKCQGPMRIRQGRRGDFWSCLRYPQCNGTRNL